MALTISTQDLINYPGNSKNVVLDTKQVVPIGFEGDEQLVASFSTTAYSDNTERTSIQTLYITDIKLGWCKSSGLAGDATGKFALTSGTNQLKVKMDTTVSGTDGNGYYTITLDYNADGTPRSGSVIAADMEEKIRALTMATADTGFQLSYLNASVEFKNNRFWIYSGTVGNSFEGSTKTSVAVASADSNDCSVILGFDLSTSSESIAAIAVKEGLISSSYTTDTDTLYVSAGTGVVAGDCLLITDGTNTDYFTALSGTTSTTIKVATSATNNYVGIANSYTANEAKVQILREQDPDAGPSLVLDSFDSINRHGIKSLVNQIDYSS